MKVISISYLYHYFYYLYGDKLECNLSLNITIVYNDNKDEAKKELIKQINTLNCYYGTFGKDTSFDFEVKNVEEIE